MSRTNWFVQRLRALPPDSRVLVCTHGGVITTLLASLLEAPVEELLSYNFRNTSATIVELDGALVRVTAFGSIEHLQNVPVVEDTSERLETG